MSTPHTLEIDGRVLSCYLPTPLNHDSSAPVYWVMRIGVCDVGTDIPADTTIAWDEVRPKLIAWYRRKATVFAHCWESPETLASPPP